MIYEKLLTIQKKMQFMKKNTQGYNYKYVSGFDLLSEIRPLMDELGLLLIQEVSNSQIIQQEKKIIVHNNYIFIWIDIETKEKLECKFMAIGENGLDKGDGSCHTYAERYFLMKFFHIPTDEDDSDFLEAKKNNDYPTKLELESFEIMTRDLNDDWKSRIEELKKNNQLTKTKIEEIKKAILKKKQ